MVTSDPENAKGIPGTAAIAVMIVALVAAASLHGGEDPSRQTSVYYLRLDILYSDNAHDRSNLMMIPAANEYRTENFTRITTTGTAKASGSPSAPDVLTRAKHNGFKYILEHQGLCSVKNQAATVKNSSHSSTIMSYEGAVKLPCTLKNHHYDPATDTVSVTLEVDFAPLQFPDKWGYLKLKSTLKEFAGDLFSIFD